MVSKNVSTKSVRGGNGLHVFVSIVIMIGVLIALLYIGKYLWNNVLVEVVPGIRPVPSIWYILGLDILFGILL